MSVSKEKLIKLEKELDDLGIVEKDLIEKFILGSGSGGQKVNKTNSCVYLKHLPTGFEVKCQKSREREMNRYYARKELCEKIKSKILFEKTEKEKKLAKIKKQKKRRSRKTKEKILQEKHKQSEKKSLRKKITGDG